MSLCFLRLQRKVTREKLTVKNEDFVCSNFSHHNWAQSNNFWFIRSQFCLWGKETQLEAASSPPKHSSHLKSVQWTLQRNSFWLFRVLHPSSRTCHSPQVTTLWFRRCHMRFFCLYTWIFGAPVTALMTISHSIRRITHGSNGRDLGNTAWRKGWQLLQSMVSTNGE